MVHKHNSRDQAAPIAKPNCETRCGDVTIPYPFGIGPSSSCYLYDWFEIHCDNSTIPHKPFLRLAKLEVLNISLEGALRVKNPVTNFFWDRKRVPNLTGSPFVYSQKDNRFTAVSCGFFALARSYHDKRVVGGCMSTCDKSAEKGHNHGCIGIDCCQTALPEYLTVIDAELQSESGKSTNPTRKDRMLGADYNYAFLVEEDWFKHNLSNFRDVKDMESVPVVLEWILSLDDMNSSLVELFERFIANRSYSSNENISNATSTPFCTVVHATSSSYNRSRLRCFCPVGFEGSPYLLQSCQDIDECNLAGNPCVGRNFGGAALCNNTYGGHTCYSNKTGVTCYYYGTDDPFCNTNMFLEFKSRNSRSYGIKTILQGLGMGLGLLLLLLGGWYAYKVIKKRKKIKRKEMFFKRNGGLLLEQQLSSGEINVEKIKLFTSKELEKSTDNFNVNRILGHGAQGTVYKSMLGDGRIVAVKKSKIVDQGKLSLFINEVVILSQINHRNVVKLLGCCLETEVPMLVYEFIPNGTLFQYIQGQIEDFLCCLETEVPMLSQALSMYHFLLFLPDDV